MRLYCVTNWFSKSEVFFKAQKSYSLTFTVRGQYFATFLFGFSRTKKNVSFCHLIRFHEKIWRQKFRFSNNKLAFHIIFFVKTRITFSYNFYISVTLPLFIESETMKSLMIILNNYFFNEAILLLTLQVET